jgi:hypothetical protein
MPVQKRRQSRAAACQCDPNCTRKAVPGSAFCEVHSHSCPNKPLLTGYEPQPEYEIYNGIKDIHDSHNCLAYAVGALFKGSKADDPFPQPGVFSGHKDFRKTRRKTCPDMVARMLGDMPSITISNYHDRCPPKTSKIAMAVDAKSADYHYWRQGPNGYYTHKPGSTDVVKVDASGRPIYRPDLADRNYTRKGSHLNYNRFCGYFCVPRTRRARVARRRT